MYLQNDYWIFIYLFIYSNIVVFMMQVVIQSFYLIIHQYFFKKSNSFDSIETK